VIVVCVGKAKQSVNKVVVKKFAVVLTRFDRVTGEILIDLRKADVIIEGAKDPGSCQ
jgi:predicted metal-dependent RNase